MKNKAGFTLIELMIVIAIIGILASVAIPQYQNYTRKSRSMEAKLMLGAIRTNEEQYFSEHDTYASALVSLGNPTATAIYYNFSIVTAPNDYTATASPNGTAIGAGLTGTWTVTSNGSFSGTAVTSGNNF